MIYFLSSIPRSGSTLLASLLEQREDTYVSPTSNLGETLGAVVMTFETNPATLAGQCDVSELYRTLKSICDTKYINIKEPIIFDKGREWPTPAVIDTMKKVLGEVKIVATVRPIADCIASFYLIDKSSLPIEKWIKSSELMEHLLLSYKTLAVGYEKYPDNFCIVEYSNLCNHTQRELDRVADFMGISRVDFSPDIKQVNENDNAWGIKDLHTLEPEIKETVQNTEEILGNKLFAFYQGNEFWKDEPELPKAQEPLDVALEASLKGDLEKSEEILRNILTVQPWNGRASFNLGWYEMRKGNLLKGHKYLDYGREEDVFGDGSVQTDKGIWRGGSGETVLLKMEGGFGDQFHCIRYAKNIVNKGCDVIISSSCLEIAPIFQEVYGVAAIVDNRAASYTHFDSWLPAMSAVVPLELEFSDVSGKPYIPLDGKCEGKIGVKWSGNPRFEHEQHRAFDPKLMWDVVEGFDCISLQKDGDSPDWMEKPTLDTWIDTRKQISRCDLVITSCTGMAHLSAAMGIETWIVVPILSYYLWALPGETTPHYDSVILFRQTKAKCWKEPFWNLKKALRKKRWKTDGETTTTQFIEA